jgi:hypothetical protein
LITEHGRATPLVWLTVNKAELKDRRSLYEHRVLVRLAEILPANVTVCIIADLGFGDQNLYRLLTEELHFDSTDGRRRIGSYPVMRIVQIVLDIHAEPAFEKHAQTRAGNGDDRHQRGRYVRKHRRDDLEADRPPLTR